jgi:hypothetical protein
MSERTLRSYLLLPRPGDLVKAWIFPAAFLLGVLAEGGASGEEVLRAAAVWGALELLIYQARYQWNDIRGFAADQRHPDRVARGRLPGPVSRGGEHIRASALAALGRLGLVALLASALPLELAGTLLALVAAVFCVAALYEALRARCTGGSEEVPPPLTTGILALWAVVGAGYVIRGLTGLLLATSSASLWLPLTAALTFWAFGIAFVTGRWALEALAFGRGDGRGEISWQVEPGQAREHSLALVRWLPPIADGDERGGDGSLRSWHALRRTSLSAPWNLAAVVAGCAAAATGCLLAGSADPFTVGLTAAGGAVFAAATVAPFHRRWPGLFVGALALFALAEVAAAPRPALVLLPWVAVVGAHLFFDAQSPRTLAHPLRSWIAALRDRFPGLRPRRLPPTPLARR